MKSREKNLLVFLLIMVIFVVVYYLVVAPLNAKAKSIQDDIDAVNTQINSLIPDYQRIDEIKAEIEDIKNKNSENAKKYPSMLTQENGLKLIFDIEKNIEGVEFTKASFSSIEVVSIDNSSNDPIVNNEENVDVAGDEGKENPNKESKLSIVLPFTVSIDTDYKTIKSILAYINDYQSSTVVDQITITKDERTELLQAVFSIKMYGISNDLEYVRPEFDVVEQGKDTLFSSKVVDITIDSIKNANGPREEKGDIFIAIKPTISDAEAQVVALAGEKSQGSELKSDVNGVAKLKVKFTKELEEYYVSYELDKQVKEPTKFEKGAAIEIDLYSNPRTGADDKSEVELELINETGEKVYINAHDEDEERPRLIIKSTTGDYQLR